ncbi:MAG TPA: hypothetical protein VFQ27_02760 [Xanthobacteraceae bacterium]|nr:hypothetical protein [Xanthobacteraceae bacterium]
MLEKDEIKAVVGDLEDSKVIEILHLQPTVAELEEAMIWASGDGDLLGKQGRPMSGKVAALVELLTADEDDLPPPRS